MIEVIQSDREAAASYLALLAPTMPNIHAEASKRETALARAFASHRIAAEDAAIMAAIEAAAGLIENGCFVTDNSPPKLFAKQVARLRRALTPDQIRKGIRYDT